MKLKYAALAVSLAVLLAIAGKSLADYAYRDASNNLVTVFAYTCFTTKQCPTQVISDSSGAEKFTIGNPGVTSNVTIGTTADSAWVSGNGTVISLLKNVANGIGGSIPAGSAIIGGTYNYLLGSGATGGQAFQSKGCDAHAFYDASTNGKTKMVTGVSSRKIYICGYVFATGGTATNVSLGSGTGTNCGSTFTAITPAYQLAANDRTGANSPTWNGLVSVNNADDLCILTSAGNAVQAEVWYSIQ